jgi:hypothetical protein
MNEYLKKLYLANPNKRKIMNYSNEREKSEHRLAMASGIMGIFFGSLIAFIGLAIFKQDHFGIARLQDLAKDSDQLLIKLFGAICIIYGLWRIYRAYLKIKGN